MTTDYPIDSSPLFNAIHDNHNNALKFKILKFTEPSLPRSRFKGRKWDIPEGFITPNWLVIYHDKRERVPLKNLPSVADTIVQGMVNIAKEISHCYNLTIDSTPLPFSSNRPEIKTPYVSANNFIEKEAKAVYPTPSPIELIGENAVKNAWNLTETLANLTRLTELEIENKQLHHSTLVDMKDTLKAIKENLMKNENVVVEIKGNEKIGMSASSLFMFKKLDSAIRNAKKNVEELNKVFLI